MIDFTNFFRTLKNLEVCYAIYSKETGHVSTEREIINTLGTVHAFLLCYEMMIAVLRRFLIEEIGVETGAGGKVILRRANESSLLSSPVEQWLPYVDYRNKITHTYAEEEVERLIGILPSFIDDAIALYQTLSKEEWE